jgi:lipopolysaccharide biosynthesis glycosyltransferase
MINEEDPLPTRLNSFLDFLTPHNRNLVIAFLDHDDIEAIAEALHSKCSSNSFVKSVYIRHFVQSYLTRTDRSIYIPFYAENSFLKIEF